MTQSHSPSQAAELSVLVVDDEPMVAEQLGEGLEAMGFTVHVTNSAAEALAIVQECPQIGVVITDIRMPGGDGLQLARDVQAARDEATAIEVIVITGHATIDDAATAVRSRVVDFLRKPFRLATAAEAVDKSLTQVKHRRARHAHQAAVQRRMVEGESQRDELTRRLESATEKLSALGGNSTVPDAVQDKLHAVSHALRTPLNAISASAELMHDRRQQLHTAEYQAILQEGIAEASRAVQLVEELISTEGRPREMPGQVSLAATLRHVLAPLLAVQARHKVLPPEVEQDVPVAASAAAVTRAMELTVDAALDWLTPGGTLASRVSTIQDPQRAWVCVTLVAGMDDACAAIPEIHALEAQGTRMSRTIESLGFLVASRLAERQGGRLTSWIAPTRHGVLRLAFPAAAST